MRNLGFREIDRDRERESKPVRPRQRQSFPPWMAIFGFSLVLIIGLSFAAYHNIVSAFTGPTTSPGVGGGTIRTDSSKNIGIGTTPSGNTKFLLQASSTSSSDYSLRILQSDGATPLFIVRNDGKIGIGANTSSTLLAVGGDTLLNGSLTASSISGTLLGFLNAANVASSSFASVSGGNFSFPADLTVAGVVSISGGMKVGSSTTACGPSSEGAIRYNATAKYHEYCNATAWLPMRD